MNRLVITLSITLLLSFTLTFLIRKLAIKYRVIDTPNKRSSHQKPTPRGGGLAIVICWYLAISFLYFTDNIEKNLYFAFLSGSILAVISLIDDLISLKPFVRIVTHILSASMALYFLSGFSSINILGLSVSNDFLLLPFGILVIVWFINLFNFLDGIDAYASVETISVSIVIYAIAGNNINLFLIFSVLGFLYWNWPKARIFMGDVGSTQLGYILIVFAIYLNNGNQFDFISWLILTSAFWFDASFTLFRRWRNNEVLSEAHKKHAYQRLTQSGFSHQKTVVSLIFLNTILAAITFVSININILSFPILILVTIGLYLLTRQIDKLVPFNK